MLLLFSIPLACAPSLVTAGSCSYGSCSAWIRTDNDSWQPATIHPQLHPGGTLEIIVVLTPSIPTSGVFCKLHEFGTPVYETVHGPSAINTVICCGDTLPGVNLTYHWVVRVLPNTCWINGTAPLEVFAQFSKSDTDAETLSFDALCAFIEGPDPPPYQGDSVHAQGPSSPVSNIIVCMIPIFLCTTGVMVMIIKLRSRRSGPDS